MSSDEFFVSWGSVVQGALTAVVALPLLIMGIMSCVMIRRQNDPVRSSMGFLQSLWWLDLLSVATLAPSTIASRSYSNRLVSAWLSAPALLFAYVAMALTTLTLFHLGLGILRQHQGTAPAKKWHAAAKWAAAGFCALLVVLGAAIFGRTVSYLAGSAYGRSSSSSYVSFSIDAGLAASVVNWALSLALAGLAAHVAREARWNGRNTAPMVRTYVAACALWLARSFYVMIIDVRNRAGAWEINDDEYYSVFVTFPIFDVWIQFIVIVLVFSIGLKKLGGLWSNPEGRAPARDWGGVRQGHAYPQMGYAQNGQAMAQQQQQQQQQQQGMYPPQYYPQGGEAPAEMQGQTAYAVGDASRHQQQLRQSGWAVPGQNARGVSELPNGNAGWPEVHEAPNNKIGQ
ncbi:hypothetical protein MKZ38_006757 [Zalerion maritima]|uniref:Uncharacterized protein n=1 Tax=Zalerion maritima TaxID=339359 RepID=A0AAD5WNL4_9PEZI|nr:hypothetical protein MKZ38_006757 [Zalerion maritima]